MANAKKCDICGNFYTVPEQDPNYVWEETMNTSMVRILRLNTEKRGIHHDVVLQYDVCETCLQDLLDYILTKQAESGLAKGE